MSDKDSIAQRLDPSVLPVAGPGIASYVRRSCHGNREAAPDIRENAASLACGQRGSMGTD
jgi:hypothetical protein